MVLDEGTAPWGVLVERVEVKDVRVPEQLQRAMAAEAEAAREARAKVIAAEGEHKASRSLRLAAEVIVDSPAALQVNIETRTQEVESLYITWCLHLLVCFSTEIVFTPILHSYATCKLSMGFPPKTTAQSYFQCQLT